MYKIEYFQFKKTRIEGLTVVYPFISYDERGFFMKTYERNIFCEHGILLENSEDMTSVSKKGVLRGLHFQTKHSQDKLIRVFQGEVWDVAVDLRKNSETYGKWEGFTLSADNHIGLYIPAGFAHGFLTISDTAVFSYRCGQPYEPGFDTGIRWNDPDLHVKWPMDKLDKLIISEKDQALPYFSEKEIAL